MFKLFSSIVFSFFLLFQTISFADEVTELETISEDVIPSEPIEEVSESGEPHEPEMLEDVAEEQEEISEAQKEADAAEEAELREAGVGEEPLVE